MLLIFWHINFQHFSAYVLHKVVHVFFFNKMFMLLDYLPYYSILSRLMTVLLRSQLQILATWGVFSGFIAPKSILDS